MSTGDWFTLRPLNINNYQPQIDEINNRLSSLQILTNNLNTRVTTVETRLYNLEQWVDSINIQVLNLNQQVNAMNNTLNSVQTTINDLNTRHTDLNNRVNPLFGRLDNLEALYTEINHDNLLNVPFHQPLYTVYANVVDISWYRPIKLLDGGGTDLRYLIMVVRGFSINLGENITRYWSDQIDLPIPRVNNNDFEVQYALNSPMRTRQAEYDFEFNPISKFRIGVRCYNTSEYGIINSDSFLFILEYM